MFTSDVEKDPSVDVVGQEPRFPARQPECLGDGGDFGDDLRSRVSAADHGDLATGERGRQTVAGGMDLGAGEEGLLPLTQHAMRFHGRIGYHDFEGLALSQGEQERFIADLVNNAALILRNHGTLTVGTTVGQAFTEVHFLEKAAKAQLLANGFAFPLRTSSSELRLSSPKRWALPKIANGRPNFAS